MKILAVIPARRGSKGIPGKNIKLLGGKPLLAYSIEQAVASKLLSKVMVSTDDKVIAVLAGEYGAEVPFLRPDELATDTTPSIEVIKHAVAFLELQGEYYDAVCLLQPTYPFRKKGFIDEAITTFVEKKADSLVSVLPVPHQFNPHWVFEPDEKGSLQIATGEKEIIKRRQDLPQTFFRDGALYVTKISSIKQGTLYGGNLSYILTDSQLYVNIDTSEDWEIAEQKLPHILAQI